LIKWLGGYARKILTLTDQEKRGSEEIADGASEKTKGTNILEEIDTGIQGKSENLISKDY